MSVLAAPYDCRTEHSESLQGRATLIGVEFGAKKFRKNEWFAAPKKGLGYDPGKPPWTIINR